MTDTKWTAVRHSGYGYGGDPLFSRGLETRQVATRKEQAAVLRAGGRLFDSYGAADDWCDLEMYRINPVGLIPAAPGTFAGLEVDGLAVYVPLPAAVPA